MSLKEIERDEREALQRAARRFGERLRFLDCGCDECFEDAMREAQRAYEKAPDWWSAPQSGEQE